MEFRLENKSNKIEGFSPCVVSCEHGGYLLPSWWSIPTQHNFKSLLLSHHSYDKGALSIASELAKTLQVPAITNNKTRLLIDFNRREGHPEIFPNNLLTAHNKTTQGKALTLHRMYRKELENALQATMDLHGYSVLNSIHSFTPIMEGVKREMDIGILFDPDRKHEVKWAAHLLKALSHAYPKLNIVFNKPYKGTSEGIATYFRERYSDHQLIGLEWEFNQNSIGRWNAKKISDLTQQMAIALSECSI